MDILSGRINFLEFDAAYRRERIKFYGYRADKDKPETAHDFWLLNQHRSELRIERRKLKKLAAIQHKLRKLSKLES